MSKPEFSKPFNLEHAKAGAPYCCRDGKPATVFKWDCRNHYTFVGISGSDDNATTWVANGQYIAGDTYDNNDLVMLPLGMCEGKPVFVGDVLVTCSGKKFTVTVKHNDCLCEDNTWPAPAPSDDLLMKVAKAVSDFYVQEHKVTPTRFCTPHFENIIASVTSAQDEKGGVK